MNGQNPQSEQEAITQRERYVDAFNTTMVRIWKEKVVDTDAMDTLNLYRSFDIIAPTKDDKIFAITLTQKFSEYGHYVARGTGRNTPRGNPGDLGRDNPRKRKPWFSKKYYRSMFNLREFMADNLGMQACLAMTNAFEKIPEKAES